MTPLEKVTVLYEESKEILRIVRDLKAGAKSTKKAKLTKIEKHAALMVDLYMDLGKAYSKESRE